MRINKHIIIYLITATLLISAVVFLSTDITQKESKLDLTLSERLNATVFDTPEKVMNFKLESHTGLTLTNDIFKDRWTFIVFGYTHCPDVCPATLQQLSRIKQQLSINYQEDLQVMLISVDPTRDTREILAEYITFFADGFIAATVRDDHTLDSLEQSLDIWHRKTKVKADGSYTMEHSAEVFLVDPSGRLLAKFLPPFDIQAVAKAYEDILVHHENLSNAT